MKSYVVSVAVRCSAAQSRQTLRRPVDCSMPGFPVFHYLPEFPQTHVCCWWCHPTTSPSVAPFSSCPQSFPASRCFPVSQFFASHGQSIGASVSASVLPKNILDLTGLISLLSKGLSRVFFSTIVQKHQLFSTQPSFCSNSHPWLAQFFTISRPVSFLCDSGR